MERKIKHPLSIPLWKMVHITRVIEKELDHVRLAYDDPRLELVLHQSARLLHQIVRDECRLYGVTEEEYQEAARRADLYAGAAGVNVEAAAVFGHK